jgi:hypothetical protein
MSVETVAEWSSATMEFFEVRHEPIVASQSWEDSQLVEP